MSKGMSPKEMAELLNGREYGREMTKLEEQLCKDFGFVVVFGASDDLIELSGCINDEAGCYNGGELKFTKEGFHWKGDENNGHWIGNNKIRAIWCKNYDDNGRCICWTYETDIPHEEFMIYEDDEPYCRGLVIRMDDLK